MFNHLLNAIPKDLESLLKFTDIPNLPDNFTTLFKENPREAMDIFLSTISNDVNLA